MNCRERLLAAVRGGEVDRKPVIHWPYWEPASDITHYNHETLPDHLDPNPEGIALVEITNPFGLSLQNDLKLNQLLKDDPVAGNKQLTKLCDEVRLSIEQAFHAGADGILYRIYGARERHCTPMQYGGYYLERDREILETVKDATFNMIFVVGDEDVYLDFVSDLPAHAFGWDFKDSKIPASEVRAMRQGALVSSDPESDILLDSGTAFLSRMLESCLHTEDSYV